MSILSRIIMGISAALVCIACSAYAAPLELESDRPGEFNCSATPNCNCLPNSDGFYIYYKISCPELEPNIHVSGIPGQILKISCTTMDRNVYSQLPTTNWGNVHSVIFQMCPLPLGGASIKSVLQRIGVNQTTTLRLSSNQIELESALNGFNDVQQLFIKENDLSNMPENLFDDFHELNYLHVRSKILELPVDIFHNLYKLNHLCLSYNNLETLEIGVFRNLRNLAHLHLKGNHLRNLTKDSFIGLSSLIELDLSSNNIKALPADVFEHMTKMRRIDLSANSFESLPEGLFAKNEKLRIIDLMDNRINLDALPHAFLAGLRALEEVTIRCNVKSVPDDMFKGSTNIRNVTMASNALATLPVDLFADQVNLMDLDLSDNLLSDLPDGIFTNLRSLKILRLSNNMMTRISGTLFSALIHLNELYLDNNRIIHIDRDAFGTTDELAVLRLEHNRLTFNEISQETCEFVNRSPFQRLKSLRELSLRNNSISRILVDWKLNSTQLEYLDLSYNNLSRLSFADIQFTSQQITVNLTHNVIGEINFNELENVVKLFIPNIHLILNNNPLQCDCLSSNFVRLLRDELTPKISERIKVTASILQCAGPEHMRNKVLTKVRTDDMTCSTDDWTQNLIEKILFWFTIYLCLALLVYLRLLCTK